jgi:hypothetical protein
MGYADPTAHTRSRALADARDDYLVISPLAAYSADWPTLSLARLRARRLPLALILASACDRFLLRHNPSLKFRRDPVGWLSLAMLIGKQRATARKNATA